MFGKHDNCCSEFEQDQASKNFFYSSTDDTSDESEAKRLEFVSGGHIIPKSTQKPAEDAFFANKAALGIADGVGGWANFGIDSSEFSNELMQNCNKHANLMK
mmetsp:Transcript_43268/g.50788  ORF Transcript_43268/g.50788 Transcript_43268/m.50788 type:complete len:102 (-) Transcript_43268:356-661(-)